MKRLLSRMYAAAVARRNKMFDAGRRPIVRVDAPVISIGNISSGGTGKTPVVQLVVRLLQEQGMQPGVVLRGYKRTTRGLVIVHDGDSLRATVEESGDEAYLHASALNVPVVVCEDKVEAAAIAVGVIGCNVVVVDDGYQHRALHRDVDIVIVDAATIDGDLLPVGRLREPLANLSRAHIVLCTRDVHEDQVRPFLGPGAHVLHLEVKAGPVQGECSHSVVAVAGIAKPERFVQTLEGCGYNVVRAMFYNDHHRYTARDIEAIIKTASADNASIVTTEKDAVKLQALVASIPTITSELCVLPIVARTDTNELLRLLQERMPL